MTKTQLPTLSRLSDAAIETHLIETLIEIRMRPQLRKIMIDLLGEHLFELKIEDLSKQKNLPPSLFDAIVRGTMNSNSPQLNPA
jgi:hypothetical protein